MKAAIEVAELIRHGAEVGACDYGAAIGDLLAYWAAVGETVRGVPESDTEARGLRDSGQFGARGEMNRVRSDLSTVGCTVGRGVAHLLAWERHGWTAPDQKPAHYPRAFRAGLDPENVFRCEAAANGEEVE